MSWWTNLLQTPFQMFSINEPLHSTCLKWKKKFILHSKQLLKCQFLQWKFEWEKKKGIIEKKKEKKNVWNKVVESIYYLQLKPGWKLQRRFLTSDFDCVCHPLTC